MNILLLNANRVGVGTYHRALNFGRALCNAGHSATLVTVSNAEKWRTSEFADVPRFRIIHAPNFLDELLPWHSSGMLDIALRCREVFRGDYDVVYAFEYQPNVTLPALAAKYLKGIPLVSDWCDWYAGASYHFGGYRLAHAIDKVFEEFIRFRAGHITVINNVLRQRALSIGIPAERITLIREGVDTSYIKPMDRQLARHKLGISAEEPIVGTIRDSLSGALMLLEASQTAGKRGRVGNPRFMFIGRPFPELQQAAESRGMGDRVIFPGRVSDEDLPVYLAAADILALPLEDTLANRGRWPHKLGDMAAAERPLIASLGGEFPQLLVERQAALAVEHTAPAFAEAIESILAKPDSVKEMARNARTMMVEELEWSVLGPKIVEVVEATARKRA